jgi:rhomboid-like protein
MSSALYLHMCFRSELNRLWNSLSTADRVFLPICLANVAVFAAWRVPALLPFMSRYFAANPANPSICLPMLLSAFSHFGFLHLAANMYVLHSFMGPILNILGKEQFVGLYLSAGVISSLASHYHKVSSQTSLVNDVSESNETL